MANLTLNRAQNDKKDEFYTQLTDIEKELRHYRDHFKDKVVLCNCDDPYESNFFKYFAMNFNVLGLKKLIATCYNGSLVQGSELMIDFGDFTDEPKKIAFKVEITEVKDLNGDGRTDLSDVQYLIKNDKNVLSLLKGNGDFRSSECIELLKESDIVVTNPPFSLFREFVSQLIKFNKKFLIIGNQNNVTYKEIFPLLKYNKLWLGVNYGTQEFKVPLEYEHKNTYIGNDGNKYAKFGNICWFTNLDIRKRHEHLILYKAFNVDEYPKYDNYDAIDIKAISDIPMDYYDIMGVPITFMTCYNPEQFEILGLTDRNSPYCTKIYTKSDAPNYSDLNRRSVLLISGRYKMLFPKILIRRKQNKK